MYLPVEIGDAIEVDETVCEVETQKTALPVRSDVAGKLHKYLVEDGDTVVPGQKLFEVAVGEAGSSSSESKVEAPAPAKTEAPTEKPAEPAPQQEAAKATPPSTAFPPAGPTASKPVPKAAPPPPKVAAPSATTSSTDKPMEGRTEHRVRMTRMRQTIASRLKDAQNTVCFY